jgi:4-hydroxy-tetrahydrodipicolinate synthase
LTLATNPIPIKAAVSILNLASDEMRLPMTNLDDEEKVVLKKTLKEYGLM